MVKKSSEPLPFSVDEDITYILENLDSGVFLLSSDGRILYGNKKSYLLTGLKPKELIGHNILSRLTCIDRNANKVHESFIPFTQNLINKEDFSLPLEFLVKKEDLKEPVVLSSLLARTTSTRGDVSFVLSFKDLNEKDRIGIEYFTARQKYHNIFNSVNDGIIIYDIESLSILELNSRAADIFGFTREEMMKIEISSISAVENGFTGEKAIGYAKRAIAGEPQSGEWLAKRKDKTKFWVNVLLQKIEFGTTNRLMATIKDIDLQKKIEMSLKKSEAQYRAFIENSPDVIMRFDRDHKHLYVNEVVKKVVGIEPEAFLNKTHQEMGVFPEEMCDFWEKQLDLVFETRKPHEVEFSLGEGENILSFEWRMLPDFDETGNVQFVTTIARDITEKTTSSKKLRKSEEMLQVILDNIPQSIFWKDIHSVYLGCNRAFAESAGLSSPSQIIGMTDFDLPWKEEETKFFLECDKRVMESNKPEYRIIEPRQLADGTNSWNNTNKVPLHDETGKVIGILGTAENITEIKSAQESLRISEERLKMALDATSDALWDWNAQTGETYFSPRYFTMLGYAPEEFKHDQKVLFNLMHPSQKESIKRYIEDFIESGKDNLEMELRLRKKDGSFAWVLSRGKISSWDNKGRPLRVVGTHVDITQRKKQEAIREVLFEIANSANSSQNLQELFESIQVSLGKVIDTKNCYVALYNEKTDKLTLPFHRDEKDKFNEFPAGKTLTGYVIKTGKSQLFDIQRIEELEQLGLIEQIGAPSDYWLGVPLKLNEKIVGVFALQSYEKNNPYTEEDVQLIEFVSDQIALAIQKKSDQDKLRETKERQRRIIESSPDGLVVINFEGNILDFNSNFPEMVRVSAEELKDSTFFDFIDENDVIKTQNILNDTLLSGFQKNFELKMTRKKGVGFYAEASFGHINPSGKESDSFVIVIKNIDERKAYESNLKIAKEKAEESDRLKTAFLSNMSHEIRTPMNAIIGFAELLSFKNTSQEERNDFIQQINLGADSLMRLIDDIIDISKIEAGQTQINNSFFKVQPILDELKSMFDKTILRQKKSNLWLKIDNKYPTEDLLIYADELRFRQIFSNLLNNAIKFTDEGEIRYGLYSLSQNWVSFYVNDTGVGIPPEKHELIFDRFRQGHESKERLYGGTGLGLAICKHFSEQMGGNIKVISDIGKGAEFRFELPFKHTGVKLPEIDFKLERPDYEWSGKTILIAEDDESNYFLLNEVLKRTMVKIIWAKDGESAVQMVENDPSVDLVLMDIQMPGMSGYEATSLIKMKRPELPVIAQTAYAMSGEREKSIRAGCDGYISKPLKMNELMLTISMQLDK